MSVILSNAFSSHSIHKIEKGHVCLSRKKNIWKWVCNENFSFPVNFLHIVNFISKTFIGHEKKAPTEIYATKRTRVSCVNEIISSLVLTTILHLYKGDLNLFLVESKTMKWAHKTKGKSFYFANLRHTNSLIKTTFRPVLKLEINALTFSCTVFFFSNNKK